MNILFVCRYNRFRSRVAEEYFNQINKNKNLHAESSGIIIGSYPLDKNEMKIAKEMGLDISGKPRGLSSALMKNTDMVVIVANNVPKKIFTYSRVKRKVIVWRIKDVINGESKVLIERKINKIKAKVRKLVNSLEDKK